MRNGLSHLAPHSFLFAAEAWILAWNVKLDAQQVLIFAAHAKFSAWQVFYVGGRSLNSGAERQIRFSISHFQLHTRSFSLAYQVIFTCVPGRVLLRTRSCSLAPQVIFISHQVFIVAVQVLYFGGTSHFRCVTSLVTSTGKLKLLRSKF